MTESQEFHRIIVLNLQIVKELLAQNKKVAAIARLDMLQRKIVDHGQQTAPTGH